MALSEKDEWLIRNGEIGYQNAAGLNEWWLAKKAAGALSYHTLPMIRDASIKLPIFFDTMTVGGKVASVQGVSWKSRFSLKAVSGPPVTMAEDIGHKFFPHAHWTHPYGMPAGFTFIPLIYRLLGNTGDGAFDGKVPAAGVPGPELGEIGRKYDYMICNAIVNDFFLGTPGPRMPRFMLRKMPEMASYVMLHKDYMKPFEPPAAGAVADFSFGYSFLPVPVKKTIFGYGPGAFKSAFKQFRFTLLENSDVEVDMLFVVSPRSQKILDLGGFDPVYSLVALLNILTLNLGFGKWAHNKLDDSQLQIHARIYQSLIDGMGKLWTERNWS
jgi:hypothetical protein